MLDNDNEAPGRSTASATLEDEPTVVLRRHARSRPVAMSDRATTTLTVLKGRHRGQVLALRPGATVVGRGQGVDLMLTDRGVSRHHARVTVDARGRVELLDLGSTNGTFVNGERVDREALRVGDLIRVGLEAVLELGQRPSAFAPQRPTPAGRDPDAPIPRGPRMAPPLRRGQ